MMVFQGEPYDDEDFQDADRRDVAKIDSSTEAHGFHGRRRLLLVSSLSRSVTADTSKRDRLRRSSLAKVEICPIPVHG